MKRINDCFKRFIDITVSILGLIICIPIIIVVFILIKVFMPGPVFFIQERIGLRGKKFNIVKFRTMLVDKEAEINNDFAKDKLRLTRLGKILRRLKLDEIPQFYNVLTGTMSLVGPRPTVEKQVIKYSERDLHRLDVKPGMTGLAQVRGGTMLTWPERIEIDLEYVNKNNVFIDIVILMKTLYFVFFNYKSKADRKSK